MLKIDNITKRFGEHIAVDNLSLQIPEKELFGFLGGNGAGKTTTFRMILSLLDPTEGRILWNDEKISYNKSHLIGYLPEERGLYPKLKVKEQLIYLAKLRGMPADESLQSLERWLERFEISHYIDKKVEELSKGNQQKIQFISAVLHEPKLLILDEPFSGLDPINVEMLKKAVIDLKNKGTSIVFSSHRMDHVEELCEHICILREGKAVVQGNLQDIKQSFGKKNIIIHSEDELQFLQEVEGVLDFKATMQGCVLQIEEERIARNVFQALQGAVFVRKYEIEEPTLNDIFIAKVGEKYE